MTEAQITAAIRRDVKEIRPITISNAQIAAIVVRGVVVMGLQIKESDPSFFLKRVSLSSYTNIFSWPSDCETVKKVWDLGTTAGTITGASSASPIVITLADHGFADDTILTQHDVGGNTEANGTFLITLIDDDSYSLDGTTYNAAYTSGGKAFAEPTNPDEINRISLAQATGANDSKWYPRNETIVVDDVNFTNDIIVDYIARPSAIADIPAEYHEALVSFGVLKIIKVPRPEDKDYADIMAKLEFHRTMWRLISDSIDTSMKASSEPIYVRDTMQMDL